MRKKKRLVFSNEVNQPTNKKKIKIKIKKIISLIKNLQHWPQCYSLGAPLLSVLWTANCMTEYIRKNCRMYTVDKKSTSEVTYPPPGRIVSHFDKLKCSS